MYVQDLEVAYFDLDESTDCVNDAKDDSDKSEQVTLTNFTSLPVSQQACYAMDGGPPSLLENIVKVTDCTHCQCANSLFVQLLNYYVVLYAWTIPALFL